MGCCSSTTVQVSISAALLARRAQTGAPVADRAVEDGQTSAPAAEETSALLEVSAHEQALTELKRIFEATSMNEQGHASKVQLADALEVERQLVALLKDAGLSDVSKLLAQLANHADAFVPLEVLLHLASMQEVQELEKEIEQGVAGVTAAGKKLVERLKELFDSLAMSEDSTVSQQELADSVSQETCVVHDAIDGRGAMNGQFDGKSLSKFITQLETNETGRITWDELSVHLRDFAPAAETCDEVAVMADIEVLEEDAPMQRCCGCL